MWSVEVNTILVHHLRQMKQTDPQFKLRLPQDLKDQVEASAAANRRSATSEIVARLQHSFKPTSLFETVGEIALEHANVTHNGDSPSAILAMASTIARLEYKLLETEASLFTQKLYRAELAAYLAQMLSQMSDESIQSLDLDEAFAITESVSYAIKSKTGDLMDQVKAAALDAEAAVRRLKRVKSSTPDLRTDELMQSIGSATETSDEIKRDKAAIIKKLAQDPLPPASAPKRRMKLTRGKP